MLHTVLLQMLHGQVCVIIKMIKSINLLIQNSRQHENLMKSLSQHCTNSFTNSKNNVSADVQWKSKYCNNNWSNQISELWILYSTGVLRINKSEYLISWKSNLPSRKSVRHLQTTLIYQKLFIWGNIYVLPYNIKSVTTITQFSNVIHNIQRTSQQTIHCTIRK